MTNQSHMDTSARPAPASDATARPGQLHRFTCDEVAMMIQAGLIAEKSRLELIHGELFDMPAEGNAHVELRSDISHWFARLPRQTWRIVFDGPLALSDDTAPEPDLYIYPAGIKRSELTGAQLALVIEVAETSLTYDLGEKAELYACHGVPEYWVIDIAARTVTVHRDPSQTAGYGYRERFSADDTVTPAAIPEAAFRLTEASPTDPA